MCHVYIRGTLTLIWLAAAIFSGQGVTWIFSTNWAAIFFTKARLRGKEDMRLTAANLFRFLGRIFSVRGADGPLIGGAGATAPAPELPPAFPEHAFQCGIHRAPGIVNDVVRDSVSVLCGFQLVEAKFDDDLFICCQLDSFDEADKQLPIGGCGIQEPLHQFFC